ncbi:MAG: calcium/sodium antiporter [Schleiferiaceae bacterium]|jgi:cation:H+ antiporter|nr:calcium/sodium antiporter [Schleiferiaceae bacterium]
MPDLLDSYLFVILGLVFLLVGGHFLVSSSVGIALKYNVSTMVIGLTLVSFATSAPELLVSLIAANNDHPDIALGNVIGSNIANIGLILGLTAMLFTLPVRGKSYMRDWLFLSGITLLVYIMLWTDFCIHWYEGFGLFLVLIGFNVYKIRNAKNEDIPDLESEIDVQSAKLPMWRLIIELALGIAGLKFGAEFLVNGANDIALDYGISERTVSVSVVALGTSLPELVASLVAAKKGEKDLAIGNVIGSNIFNILAVLGLTAGIAEIRVEDMKLLKVDFIWVIAFTFLLYPLTLIFKKYELGKRAGWVMFLAYCFYIYILISNGKV